ncbi:MAG: hypothetical protein Q8O52_28105 [Sulfuritalea sp.]|nr:hypothetical protein [Sulfuritalea sp.]
MNLEDIEVLLGEARKLISHSEYVVIGSLSVIGMMTRTGARAPDRMLMSNDLDCYPLRDPGRAFELEGKLGFGSEFERRHGYYLDPVSPDLPTLPDGWRDRMVRVDLDNGVVIMCLDPNDAAVSKYARSEPRDREWIRAGIAASILSLATIRYRFSMVVFLDLVEQEGARAHLAEDEAWWEQKAGRA